MGLALLSGVCKSYPQFPHRGSGESSVIKMPPSVARGRRVEEKIFRNSLQQPKGLSGFFRSALPVKHGPYSILSTHGKNVSNYIN